MSDDPSRERPPTLWSRRSLLNRLSWGVLSTTIGGGGLAGLSALVPRVRPAPPTRVVLGRPEELAVGEISERWKKEHRLFLARTEQGFYALRSVCTHLGCVPGWQGTQKKFKCFCHGSGFRPDGANFEGPAPRPLERLHIELDPAGRIVVDTAIRYRAERGEWTEKGAFLPWPAKA